jgi:hypothetical protein
MIFRIFNKKTIIITYFILNVYAGKIDKNDRKLKKCSQAIYSKLATTKPTLLVMSMKHAHYVREILGK